MVVLNEDRTHLHDIRVVSAGKGLHRLACVKCDLDDTACRLESKCSNTPPQPKNRT